MTTLETKTTKATPIINRKSVLGEGSLWDSNAGLLYWVDILDHKVFVYNPSTEENKVLDVKSFPSTIVKRESGGAIVTLQNGFATVDLESGEAKIIEECEADLEGNRFNDGKCDPQGRLWAGTMGFNLEEGQGSLYLLSTDGKAQKVLGDISCSNGIVWTKDEKTMYYIDSVTYEVHGFDYNAETGAISNRRTVVSIPKEVGLPDGMSIDEEGMLWVALFWGGAVNRYNPETGELLEIVEVPGADLVTSCPFGGENLDELYITTASCDYKDEDWEKHPNAGNLFKANVGVKGVSSNAYKG
jgi:sugar lactone lactonase YvrE